MVFNDLSYGETSVGHAADEQLHQKNKAQTLRALRVFYSLFVWQQKLRKQITVKKAIY